LIPDHKLFIRKCRHYRGEHKRLIPSYNEFTIPTQLWRCAVADVGEPLRLLRYHHAFKTELTTPLLDQMKSSWLSRVAAHAPIHKQEMPAKVLFS
jgi:hypothetical protein